MQKTRRGNNNPLYPKYRTAVSLRISIPEQGKKKEINASISIFSQSGIWQENRLTSEIKHWSGEGEEEEEEEEEEEGIKYYSVAAAMNKTRVRARCAFFTMNRFEAHSLLLHVLRAP